MPSRVQLAHVVYLRRYRLAGRVVAGNTWRSDERAVEVEAETLRAAGRRCAKVGDQLRGRPEHREVFSRRAQDERHECLAFAQHARDDARGVELAFAALIALKVLKVTARHRTLDRL